ncbi:MAG: serine/threonine protein kinase [Phycisphaerales bacterium]|nr:serine/threonine protein kinase [Phycisphaerales bacterium]
MNEPVDREQEIFAEALERKPELRAAYLDSVCAGDPELREQIDSLLSAMDGAGSAGFLDQPTGGLGDTPNPDALSRGLDEEHPGAIIGRYKLVSAIGQGGFGTVYKAEQTEPIQRAVALKIIKLGMDTRQVISRFEAERQALAMMDHPSIAAVYDAGATASGRPYFVMELVRGAPITVFCDERKLSIPDRLALFQDVCAAVQHAHQKGVIHRDLKPSNVLVGEHDGRFIPKVIDFGIAKATGPGVEPEVTMTVHGRAIGTPAYMSPEQARSDGAGIDTRTDIYSLGVLLYELLTGTTPFLDTDLRSKPYADMIQMITDQDPPKPSDRVSSLSTAANTDGTRQFRGPLASDLDWIVMRCLEKDPSRRYETVSGLAEDIERYLSNEPVSARPPSGAYRFRKFVQRNRGQVIAGSALLGVLLLGIAGTTWGLVWALDERASARQAAEDELAAQIAATTAAEQAKLEAERAAQEAETSEELSRFFILDVLSAADPARTANRELTVREALMNASENIEGRFEDRPDIEEKIQNALGYLFGRLGLVDLAEKHHRREWALTEQQRGEDSFEAARIMHSVVGDLAMREQDDEAIELSKRQLKILDQLDTPEAAQLRTRVIGNLGALLVRAGRIVEAAPILEDTLRTKRELYGDRHPTTLTSIEAISVVLRQTGDTERALPLAEEAYDGQTEVLGEGDPRTLNSLVNLAQTYTALDRLDDARSLLTSGVDRALERLGNLHPTTIYLRNHAALSLFNLGDFEGAEKEILALMPDVESVDPEMLQQQSRTMLSTLASCSVKEGRIEDALESAERALASARAVYPDGDIRLSDYLKLRGDILRDLERFADAEGALLEAWKCTDREDIADEQSGPILRSIVRLYEAWDASEPDQGHREQIELWRSRLSPG